MKTFDVAVVGATGAVGEALLEILAQRKFPVGQVYALASERSAGGKASFGGRELTVGKLSDFDFKKAQIGFFSAGSSVSEEYAPKAAAAGWKASGCHRPPWRPRQALSTVRSP